jgi:hypothetical protein
MKIIISFYHVCRLTEFHKNIDCLYSLSINKYSVEKTIINIAYS